MRWKLLGCDTFAREYYPLDGEYDSEAEAINAAKNYLTYLEETQPTSSSGGQDGIQDQVFIVALDGTTQRVLP